MTVACIEVAKAKIIAAADKLCSGAGAAPSCGPYPYPSGADWANLMGIATDGYVPQVYCTFPSRAFVE